MTAVDIFGIGICALCAVVFGALLKKSNKEYALIMSGAAAVLILLAVLEKAAPLIHQLESLTGSGVFRGEYLTVMLKAVGVTLAGQMASQICKDAGEAALANAVDIAAKTAILTISFPLLTQLFSYLEQIIKV